MNILAAKKPKVTYASLEMMRYVMNPMREIGSNIDHLAEHLERSDPDGKEAYRIAGKYMVKGD